MSCYIDYTLSILGPVLKRFLLFLFLFSRLSRLNPGPFFSSSFSSSSSLPVNLPFFFSSSFESWPGSFLIFFSLFSSSFFQFSLTWLCQTDRLGLQLHSPQFSFFVLFCVTFFEQGGAIYPALLWLQRSIPLSWAWSRIFAHELVLSAPVWV